MHPDKPQIHLYLAGALEPAEREALEAHLADCTLCTQVLAELAAEDTALLDALEMDETDRAWIASVDLVEPVMAQVNPRFRLTPPVILTSLLVCLGGYLAGSIWSLGTALLPDLNSMRTLLGLARDLVPALLRLAVWLAQGGVLTTIWPVLALCAVYGFWRLTQVKETNNHA